MLTDGKNVIPFQGGTVVQTGRRRDVVVERTRPDLTPHVGVAAGRHSVRLIRLNRNQQDVIGRRNQTVDTPDGVQRRLEEKDTGIGSREINVGAEEDLHGAVARAGERLSQPEEVIAIHVGDDHVQRDA